MIIEHKGRRGSSFYVRVNGPEGNKFYGKPIRSWELAGGKREAQRLARKRESDILTGRYARRETPTAEDYVDRLLRRLEAEALPSGRKRKRGTLRTLRYNLSAFKDDFRGRRLDRIARSDAIDWAQDKSAGELKVVRQLFNAAVDEEIVEKNPFRGLSKPSGSRAAQAPPTAEEFERLLAACAALDKPGERHPYGPVFRAFLAFAGYSGLRPGELFALEWRDVDFERMRVNVERNFAAGVVDLPKSGATREVVLTPPARDALLTLPRVSDLVFTNKSRGRLTGASCHNYWSVVRAKAGLPITLYLATRHRFAHHLRVERGLDWRVVREQLGHADESLEKVYGHTNIGWMGEIEASYGMNVRHLEVVAERKANEKG